MTREDLEQLLTRKPFHPFKVTLTTGEAYDVMAPGRVAVGPNYFAIEIEEEGKKRAEERKWSRAKGTSSSCTEKELQKGASSGSIGTI